MIISIKDNWVDAEADHASYVNGRVRDGIKYYSSRLSVNENIVEFLKAAKSAVSHHDLEDFLRTIPVYLKLNESITSSSSRSKFRSCVLSPKRSAQEIHDIGEKEAIVFFSKNNSPELYKIYLFLFKFESLCVKAGRQVDFYKHLVGGILESRKKYKGFDFIRDVLDPYLCKSQSRKIADQVTVDFLRKYCTNIGVSKYSLLRKSVQGFLSIKSKFSSVEEYEEFVKNLHKVFDYDQFLERNGNGWNAYKLCGVSRTRTCPYCNQAYAFTIVREGGGGFRPTLDHFLPRSQFPHLALSLYNLVPSCYTCNSNLKGKKDFYKNPHLNPLCDDIEFRFSIDLKSCSIIDLLNNFDVLKNEVRLSVEFDEKIEEIRNSMTTFMIEDRYQPHIQEAIEFASLRFSLDRGRLLEVSQILDGRTEAQLLRFDRSRYRETLLGKLYADIFDAFKPDNYVKPKLQD